MTVVPARVFLRSPDDAELTTLDIHLQQIDLPDFRNVVQAFCLDFFGGDNPTDLGKIIKVSQ